MPKRVPMKRGLILAASVALCGLALTARAFPQGAMQPNSGGMSGGTMGHGTTSNGAMSNGGMSNGAMGNGAMANSQTDLSGTYQCSPNPDPCLWPGASPSISQSGNKLQIKGDNGGLADATLTSSITISAGGTFNSFGTIRPDHSIDWSDGTKWRKK
jgi:pentapeptide MXKDX repeat protein